MRGFIGWSAALLVVGLGVGCSGGVGSASGDLFAVDRSITERTDLFLDPAVDSRPLTEEQLVDLSGELSTSAVPVTVEIVGGHAIAWLRADRTDRTRADIVAVWTVEGSFDLSTATPIGDELHRPTAPVYIPGGSIDVSNLPTNLTDTRIPGGGFIIIDFTDRFDTAVFTEPELWQNLNEAHPGCA